jgi:hypothetical protein
MSPPLLTENSSIWQDKAVSTRAFVAIPAFHEVFLNRFTTFGLLDPFERKLPMKSVLLGTANELLPLSRSVVAAKQLRLGCSLSTRLSAVAALAAR